MTKFYELITNVYPIELTAWNDLPDYLSTSYPFVKMKWQTS
jgi:hypothetical protein